MKEECFDLLCLEKDWLNFVWSPVSFPRLFEKMRNQYCPDQDELSKDEVDVMIHGVWDEMIRTHEVSATLKTELLYFEWLSHASLHEAGLTTRSQIIQLLHSVRSMYARGRITAGEAVGQIAAQCIGEPVTQLSLNSFHQSGLGTELTTGVFG